MKGLCRCHSGGYLGRNPWVLNEWFVTLSLRWLFRPETKGFDKRLNVICRLRVNKVNPNIKYATKRTEFHLIRHRELRLL